MLKSLPEDGELFAQVNQIKKGTFGTDPWTKGQEDPEGLLAELDVLYDYLALVAEEATAKTAFATATRRFHEAVIEKYPELADDEIKELVVNRKWLQRCRDDLDREIDAVAQRLTDRLSVLSDRYGTTLPAIERETEEVGERVPEHLRELGFSWS